MSIVTEIEEKISAKTAPIVGFVSLGCPKNLVDSEVMMGLLDYAGARLTANPEEAEILVVNTCSFIDTAKQESVDTILEMARHKTEGRAKKLIVAGCLVERYRDEIRKSIPEVDAVVGTGELEAILEAAGLKRTPVAASPFTILTGSATVHAGKEALAGTHHAGHEHKHENSPMGFRAEGDHRETQGRFDREEWQGASHLLPTYLYDESTPRLLSTGKTSAYIKIAEGCDHPCTFCVIPNLRGKFRSRRFESVVAEARQLVSRGVQEITLIGQDTTCYGEDFGLKDGLSTLLDELAQIPGLRWLRFLYAYPNRITGKLLETIAKHDNICKYLDVPLQHASPSVLKIMKRGAGAEIFLKTIEKVRKAVPGIVLRTSFIVGFPGESLRDFELLEEFITEAKFDWLGVFNYSDEEGSKAHALDAKVPKRTIEARKRRLMKLQQGISKRARQEWVGREAVVLVEGESEETPLLWEGRTQFHAPEIDGKVYINDFGDLEALEAGRFYRAKITEAHEYDVVARIISGPLPANS
ncbi:30S ribosomal protein S12 methylthiotransferase RimO [Terracidiphilus sp.]|uniref:30S ribosomal protein S12 methylthiotransferase RimO n=1 Tax=Terracidiphilus sp. TaxID=1964191 RepID=UPI003C15FD10